MTGFWIVAALLLAGALLFVVPPLLRGPARETSSSQRDVTLRIHRDQLIELQRDRAEDAITQEQYDSGKREIERRVLEETESSAMQAVASQSGRWLAVAVAVLVPALALGLYSKLGNPDGLEPQLIQPVQSDEQGGHSITPQQIEAMVAQLAEKLAKDPENAEGWQMLARANVYMQRYDQAVKAFAEYTNRVPGDAQALADYADALAMAKGRTLAGEPEAIIAKALAADPNNVKALALAGSAEFNKQAYDKAIRYWERILAVVPPESPIAQSTRNGIAEARAKGNLPGSPSDVSEASSSPAAGGNGKVSGTVTLAPALAAKAAPEDVVFVFARAPEGPKMPLAILRKQVKDLPVQFVLDDSMAMAPSMRLSSFPKVVIGARISKSGDAQARRGDLQGATPPLAVGAEKVAVVIDSEVN
ncbi:MAG TPA: c-type cytochrome biogenesis protein CcmI [Rhodocyclaceae bacterium]|nr:c-type cytochrome biogenesis protein CcmI [Rhodocyclaceae bacterium]HMV53208.1 c-type cytochrome biogenesis protein CcmI [Rhodocyclaceae bacterium]HNA02434.1 c-type cytochrome biogenesis protein CcmI [Rhodocyclaceae bacterium]HNB77483.1 c-type cytochrome biogenesis protein CcmI [Rhodocyclaceae bacterium]HNC60022.1 c-type cytochrome biogenesis protein CcmI [Rhodocyclaceae bacterium]